MISEPHRSCSCSRLTTQSFLECLWSGILASSSRPCYFFGAKLSVTLGFLASLLFLSMLCSSRQAIVTEMAVALCLLPVLRCEFAGIQEFVCRRSSTSRRDNSSSSEPSSDPESEVLLLSATSHSESVGIWLTPPCHEHSSSLENDSGVQVGSLASLRSSGASSESSECVRSMVTWLGMCASRRGSADFDPESSLIAMALFRALPARARAAASILCRGGIVEVEHNYQIYLDVHLHRVTCRRHDRNGWGRLRRFPFRTSAPSARTTDRPIWPLFQSSGD
ncbi:hypothetical protein C8Q72DRAFT_236110 [Fomitopsis betulina]|nr:hypothetical protein C8Q72DRAFT_236110 [Fomitopsis betulina]